MQKYFCTFIETFFFCWKSSVNFDLKCWLCWCDHQTKVSGYFYCSFFYEIYISSKIYLCFKKIIICSTTKMQFLLIFTVFFAKSKQCLRKDACWGNFLSIISAIINHCISYIKSSIQAVTFLSLYDILIIVVFAQTASFFALRYFSLFKLKLFSNKAIVYLSFLPCNVSHSKQAAIVFIPTFTFLTFQFYPLLKGQLFYRSVSVSPFCI